MINDPCKVVDVICVAMFLSSSIPYLLIAIMDQNRFYGIRVSFGSYEIGHDSFFF